MKDKNQKFELNMGGFEWKNSLKHILKVIGWGLFLLLIYMAFSGFPMSSYLHGFASASDNYVYVGAYYYGWYHGGYNSHGWNESFYNETLKDKPFLGYYNNWNDTFTMKQHIAWLDDLGIDFLLLSWSANHSEGIDDNAPLMFQTRQNYGHVKFAICVEPFNQTYHPETYNWTWIHDFIWNNFCKYSFYFDLYDKPLVTYMMGNGLGNMTTVTRDERFTQVGIGGDDGGGRSEGNFPSWILMWAYTNLTPESPNVYVHIGPKADKPNGDRCWAFSPRYDDVACRRRNLSVDVDFSEGVYIDGWESALKFADKNEIDVTTISTFNEYMERTFIEPCFDNTSFSDNPFYLYNITKDYIQQLRNPEPTDPWFYNAQNVGFVFVALVLGIYFFWRLVK